MYLSNRGRQKSADSQLHKSSLLHRCTQSPELHPWETGLSYLLISVFQVFSLKDWGEAELMNGLCLSLHLVSKRYWFIVYADFYTRC